MVFFVLLFRVRFLLLITICCCCFDGAHGVLGVFHTSRALL